MTDDNDIVFEELNQECVVCKGTTNIRIAGSAYLIAFGKQHRVYFHKSCCMTEEQKKVVVEDLNKKAGIS